MLLKCLSIPSRYVTKESHYNKILGILLAIGNLKKKLFETYPLYLNQNILS
jgi:hypothetical protein